MNNIGRIYKIKIKFNQGKDNFYFFLICIRKKKQDILLNIINKIPHQIKIKT
jgi:hypothetical protein